MRRSILSVPVLVAALVAALVPAGARADGLPVLGVDVGSTGVASSSDAVRYVTIPAGTRTIVAGHVHDSGGCLRRLGRRPVCRRSEARADRAAEIVSTLRYQAARPQQR